MAVEKKKPASMLMLMLSWITAVIFAGVPRIR